MPNAFPSTKNLWIRFVLDFWAQHLIRCWLSAAFSGTLPPPVGQNDIDRVYYEHKLNARVQAGVLMNHVQAYGVQSGRNPL